MFPSIMASGITGDILGGLGAGANVIKGVSGAVGSAIMGASAAGNAYSEKVKEGFDPKAARTYSALVGASEAGLQYILGGISKLGGIGEEAIAAKISGIDNAIARVALSLGSSMLSEGTEEGLQEVLEPALASLIFDVDYDVNFEDVAYSAILGALSAGIIEGPGTVAAEYNTNPSIEAYDRAQAQRELPAAENAMKGGNVIINPLIETYDRAMAQRNAAQTAQEAVQGVQSTRGRVDGLQVIRDMVNGRTGTEGAVAEAQAANAVEEQKNNATEGETSSDTGSLVGQLRSAIPQIMWTNTVATVSGSEIQGEGKAVDRIMNFVKSIGGKVTRNGFGEVLFSRAKIKSSVVGHGSSDSKIDLFAAVPGVIRDGVQIGHERNWKGRNYDTYIFAAPVTYKGVLTYVGVVVQRDSQSNRYYLHEAVDAEGSILYKERSNPASPSDSTSALAGDLETVADAGFASENTVSQSAPFVNPESTEQGTSASEGRTFHNIGAADAGFTDSAYNRWVEDAEHLHPQGEKAVRNASLPTVNPQGEKTSKVTQTLMEAEQTTDANADALGEEAVKGRFTIPDSMKNDERVMKARAEYALDPGKARSDWTSAVASGKANADLVAMGAVILDEIQHDSGVSQGEFLNIAESYIEMCSRIGQAMQAQRIYKALTPYDRMMLLKRVTDAMNKSLKLAEGEGISVDEALVAEYLKAEDGAARDAVMDKIYQNVADQVPSTFRDKWTALRYMNMLGNFKTQGRNIIGNLTMTGMKAVKNEVAVAIEAAVAMAKPDMERSQSFKVGKAWMKAAKADFENVRDIAQGNRRYSPASASRIMQEVEDRRTIFKNSGTWGTEDTSPGIAKAARKLTDVLWKVPETYRRVTNWATNAGDDDDEEVDALMNRQDYSLVVPGVGSYTIDWLTPATMPLFMGSTLWDVLQEDELTLADIDPILSNFAEPILETSMLSGLSDALDTVRYADSPSVQLAAQFALGYLTQGVTNSLFGQLERTSEPNRMTTYIDADSPLTSFIQYELGKASAKIPGWDYHQTEYHDELGHTESNGTWAERVGENLFSPGYWTPSHDNDPLYSELQELHDQTGANPWPDTSPPKSFTVDGEKYSLSQAEKEQYRQTQTSIYEDLAGQLFAGKENLFTPEEAVDILLDITSYAGAQAKQEYYDKKDIDAEVSTNFIAKGMAAVEEADIPFVTYLDYWAKSGNLEYEKGVSGAKKAAVVKLINSMDLTAEQKDWLYLDAGYAEKSIGETPWH